MPSFVSYAGWARRNLAWSNSRQSWEERLAGVVLLAGALGLWWLHDRLASAQQVILWGLLLAVAAVLLRRSGLNFFGPVFFYELLRIARRRRYFVFRTLYATALLFLLGWLYLMWTLDWSRGGAMRASRMADFAGSFFYTFMAVQFALVLLLTPIYTAGAIAEEKDRKTLEFVLATDLRNREIVLGKLAARLGNLALLVLAGLPILSFLQFLGGVDPDLVLAGFAATGVTMLSLGALGMLCSVLARKPRDAIVLTYLVLLGYHLVSGACWLLLVSFGGFPSFADLLSPFPVKELVEGFNAGNIGSTLGRLVWAYERGGRLDDTIPGLLRDYASCHGLVAAVCMTWAVLRLRAVALKQSYDKPKKARWRIRLGPRLRIGVRPMLWKEIHAEPGLLFHWTLRVAVGVLVVLSFIPPAIIIGHFLNRHMNPGLYRSYGWSPWEMLAREMNVWVRIVGTFVACLMLLAVAVRAAGSISGERDRQTFDSLVITPLDSTAILFAKWLGSILCVRWAWLWLGLIWLLGLVTGGMNPLAVPLVAGAWLVYAAVFAGLGVWLSMSSRTTLRATVGTLLTAMALGGGHWLLTTLCCFAPLSLLGVRGRNFEWIMKLEFGQTPPLVMGLFAFITRDVEEFFRGKDAFHITGSCLFGIVCWAGLAVVLWQVASRRFRAVTGLLPLPRPRLRPPRRQILVAERPGSR